MNTKSVEDEEQLRRFKERVAQILRDYEEKIQEARNRYDKKNRVDG
ncbi:MAG: hypothetical protein AAF517_25655 [Planctomycetota bacterium]